MKKSLILILLSLLLASLKLSAQDLPDTLLSNDSSDSLNTDDDSLKTSELNPVREYISGLIKEINTRFMSINMINSSGEIKIKSPKADENASIDIRAKKKDDLWFKIEGPLGIDVAQAHFERKRFVFLNDLNDEAYTGSTTILNIGALTKIRCTFDDLLNVFTGSVRISKAKTDSLWIEGDTTSQYCIGLKRGTITKKYWVFKDTYSVYKYAYYSKTGQTLIQFEFSNFMNTGDGAYAKRVEVRRPKQNEYFKLEISEFNFNQSYLDFNVSIPSDYKRKVWK